MTTGTVGYATGEDAISSVYTVMRRMLRTPDLGHDLVYEGLIRSLATGRVREVTLLRV